MAEELNGAAPASPQVTVAVETPAPAPAAAPDAPAAVDKPTFDTRDRKSVIADAMAKRAEEKGDSSLRQRMIERGIIKPAQPKDGTGQVSSTQRGAHAAAQPRVNGKFAGPPAAAPAPHQAAPQAVAPAVSAAPAVQRPALPKWLAKEIEPHWNQAPPELLAAVHKYGEDANVGITKYKSAAQERDALMAEFRPYEQLLRADNATPQTAIRNLMQTAAALRAPDPGMRAQTVAKAMQKFNIPFAAVAQHFGFQVQGADGQPVQIPQQDPQLTALMQEVNALKGSIQSQRQSAEQAEAERLAKITEAFGKDRPHYEALKPQIARLLNGGLVDDVDGKSEAEILQAAYDMALRLNPELYAQHVAQERDRAAQAERDRANQLAQQARAASVQVRGAPGGSASTPNFDPRNRADVIRHAIRSATGR